MAGYGAVGLTLGRMPMDKKTHIVTLSFDDGFKKSFYKTAEIFEQFGLHACLNVIAAASLPEKRSTLSGATDVGVVPTDKGTFEDWNKLKRRGHEVMAHTWDHTNLTEIPLEQAKEHITKCAEAFETHLRGFKASKSVYNFAYNASNAELDAFVLTKFLVARTQGVTPVNPIPTTRKPVRIGCWSQGPGNCDAFFDDALNKFLASEGGWFVFNTHGLDEEGWGPMSSKYLNSLLDRLTKMKHVEVLPAGQVVLRLHG